MDELEISGKRYISSVRAAKEHKYHADYIGQLVRGGKVTGQKVGRAWYVEADSLTEYLGKEVPPRGPVVKEEKVMAKKEEFTTKIKSGGPEKVPVAEHEISSEGTESEVRDTLSGPMEVQPVKDTDDAEKNFLMPLRKSNRQHVIAALDSDAPLKKEIKVEEPEEKVEDTIEEEVEDPIVATGFTEELVPEPDADPVVDEAESDNAEETFIPVKISRPLREPEAEDSFYKVSSKGLRYISAKKTAAPALRDTEKPRVIVRAAEVKPRASAASYASTISLVLVAGIISLGAGVLMSYYLHSITTIEGSGQSSTVLLSN